MKITSFVGNDTNCYGMNSYGYDTNCYDTGNTFWPAGVVPNSLYSRRSCSNENAAAPIAGIPAVRFSSRFGNDDIDCIPSTNRGPDNCGPGNFSGRSLKLRKGSLKMRLPQIPNQAVSNNS